MASSSAEQPPVEMNAKLMMATGISDCQRLLDDLLNNGDATRMVVVMVSSNQLPNAAKPPPGPVTMNPQLLQWACSGSCQEQSFFLNRNDAPGRSDVMLELGTKASSVTQQASSQVEEGVDQPAFSPALLLEGVTIEGDTALHVVATHGDTDNFLRSADVIYGKAKHLLFAQNKNGDTPLHCAARAGKSKMVSHLVAKAEDEGGERLKEFLRKENARMETALHEAVRSGDKDTVDLLVVADSELACFPRDGCSPLYQAILLKERNIAETLHDKCDGNLSYSGADGQNALHAAVLRGKAMTEMVLGWKKDLSKRSDTHGSTPLHFVVSMESSPNIRISEALISKVLEACPSSAFQPDKYGSLPIHVAASTGVRRAIAVLLEKWPGCASLRDFDGRTFLHVAVKKKRNNIVRLACKQKRFSLVLNMQDNEGNTALHLAVQLGYLRIVCALLGNKQVLLNLTNKDGRTPLDLARSKIPTRIYSYGWDLEETIRHALVRSGANHGSCRWDQFQEKHKPHKTPEDKSKESQILRDSTQTLAIGSVLIATVTFGATFALPGGYRNDDHANGGTPTLAGRYTFDAFIMANTLAFICSSIATLGFMYSGIPMVNLPVRRTHFTVSIFVLSSSMTSLVAAFALAVFMVLAPVALETAITICVISPFVVLYRNMGRFVKIYLLAYPLYIRKGLRALLSLTSDILIDTLMEFWPLILIFSWAAYTSFGHGRK